MKDLRCLLGFHDHRPEYESRRVRCTRCGDIHVYLTVVKMKYGEMARDKYRSGKWTKEVAEGFLRDIWSE